MAASDRLLDHLLRRAGSGASSGELATYVHDENDFRSVYAKVIDNWLGGDSITVLGGNFRKSGLDFV